MASGSDRTAIIIHEIDAVLRARCPMQKKWISVRGKRTSCTWCPYLARIRYTEWGAKIECKFEEGMKPFEFPMRQVMVEEEG
jgi:hypothetical protein